ncbi:MAG: hypothetical protein JWQ76_5217 [Ramlibacter sp.]|nr:hypothetical protein [Ramlibacter sp.]
MPKVNDVCSHVRSKNAGPFWITLDLWFPDRATFERHAGAPALQAASIAALYGVQPSLVKHFAIADLLVVKISYPRARPQGGVCERDMHGGQQYVRLLDVQL